jgi:UDP-N-acetylmuramyl pentapeptide phosphotransferase/UDP-N-acetylglucosamine-1-phosphate transferase
MLYYLSDALKEQVSFLNAFTYLTTRAGLALVTAFVMSVAIGPRMLEFLRALKVGQFIKKDHVESLHALHKGKGGTPTMGGLLIVVCAVATLLLWGRLSNRLLLVALAVFIGLGFVGFLDDYIKLRKKHNDGLSARAKFTGQIVVGLLLGLYVVGFPITYGAYYLKANDVSNWGGLMQAFVAEPGRDPATPLGSFGVTLSEALLKRLRDEPAQPQTRDALLAELNTALERRFLYDEIVWHGAGLNGETNAMLGVGLAHLSKREVVRFNRLLIEAASPQFIVKSPRHLQTKVAVPGLKDLMIPLGLGYVLFVVLIIVSTSNCVNLTDGLDGLAAGASVVSISAFTALAYIVSRPDWAGYLYVTYIPEAGELAVFGAAVLGAGLGFLWFNAHPAEVFMGDTGSLALGGVLGALGVLTKQELLIPIVGGLFVLEGLSVVIQVGSFKLRGKRVFKMSPLHHHFELLGWSETKVVVRFWILAFMFALLSLATLKLR